MKQISIITATYNRIVLLEQAYYSLLEQECEDCIEWIIVDDGSNDGTGDLVREWRKDNKIKIQYVEIPNSGVTTARRIGSFLSRTAWMMILDSDDKYRPGSIKRILDIIEKKDAENDPKCAGLMFPVINEFTDDLVEGKHSITEQYEKYKRKGEYQIVFKTDVYNRFNPPIFYDEKFVTESVYLRKIDMYFYYFCINERFMYREYQEGGLTDKYSETQKKNPKGYLYSQLVDISYAKEMSMVKRSVKYYSCITQTLKNEELYPEIRISFLIKIMAFLYRFDIVKLLFLSKMYPFPINMFRRHSRIALWGGGEMGTAYYIQNRLHHYCKLAIWVDSNYDKINNKWYKLKAPSEIYSMDDIDYVLIAIASPVIRKSIKEELIKNGVLEERII